ncbi:Hsp20/alpha crystallin family protein [Aliarcobacter butzleri]|jgi:HSP20 family protein|uniref:Hsp20/alpha crystallin family protein n=1 Tax=Aliarcobacter butzleri TaxID=28197 RepID=A0AAP4Q0Z1_9BACT|nr:Hsp20/alpha crystallin family protein [Aliarcobacter butzleri]MBP6323134.1 Hsp20/alpha crystallin family protein [Fusobacteriaceae bacterium]MDN5053282.1 Hsp20/alpha crystallin family protein [Aliarcobacter butzleri]MDN5062551.1 Hsp20/alpha crystallin family protein [Aliarcobacter butzleri]MDN5076512.1 Hsp20/alpha crystallin family protein [Aliarcobacter butzleri]MDN5117734.1 Hsp20/alpha crystallin family protein [Aliarcobacter butzleri]
MDFSKLAPWNWFKDEESNKGEVVPVKNNNQVSTNTTGTLLDIHREFDNLFHSLRQNIEQSFAPFSMGNISNDGWFKPSLDVATSDNEYTVKLEIPGVEAKDMQIEIDGDTMIIKGEKRQENEEKNKDFYRIERSYGSFQRVLNLPGDADVDKIESTHKDGVLTINIPKKVLPKSDTKKIEIKSN